MYTATNLGNKPRQRLAHSDRSFILILTLLRMLLGSIGMIVRRQRLKVRAEDRSVVVDLRDVGFNRFGLSQPK